MNSVRIFSDAIECLYPSIKKKNNYLCLKFEKIFRCKAHNSSPYYSNLNYHGNRL